MTFSISYWISGSYASDFFGWIAFTTNSGSMLLLTLMSIERFVAIAHPFAYKAWVRPNKILAIILTAEVFTGIHSALPLLGIGRILPYNGGAYSHFDYSRHSHGTIAYSVFIICYGFSMILVVMVAYSFVFHKIRDLIHRHKRMTNARSDGSVRRDKSMRQLNLKTETMFSYLTVALMVLFWFSWLPFLVSFLWKVIACKRENHKVGSSKINSSFYQGDLIQLTSHDKLRLLFMLRQQPIEILTNCLQLSL